MATQAERGARFKELHQRPGAFIIPNPFDIGSAKLLAGLGFEALASSSAGFAFTRGEADFEPSRNRMLKHLSVLVGGTELPVSADLQNGFAHEPCAVAATLRLAIDTGIVGASIEDATGDSEAPLYSIERASERIRAAAEVARAQPFDFTLTARAENFLVGSTDLRDVVARLQAYQEAGADVLFAPGLTRAEDIELVVRSVDRPVNVVMGLTSMRLGKAQLAGLGVKRMSVGSALARAAYGAVMKAGEEMLRDGQFTFADAALPYKTINSLFTTSGPLAHEDHRNRRR